jgi:hypothetical protein
MHELKGAEIFAVGKWNGMEFTETDLDEIANNFGTLAEIHKVPLKLGHNDEQPVTDGQPAIGWVSKVYRNGTKLLADFVDMPRTVYDAVKQRLYRTVSVELLFDVDHKGNKFGHVLDAVALLGADHPAVNTLEDLNALLASRTSFAGGRRFCFETVAGKLDSKEENDMDEKDVKAFVSEAVEKAVDPLKEELEVVKKERDDFKSKWDTSESQRKAYEAEQRKEKVTAARSTVIEILDGAVRDKAMTPAAREVYARQIGVNDDDRVLEIDIEEIKVMCSANVVPIGKTGRESKDLPVDDAGVELTRLTRVFMAEHDERDFSRALMTVAQANPDLHEQYLDSNLEA